MWDRTHPGWDVGPSQDMLRTHIHTYGQTVTRTQDWTMEPWAVRQQWYLLCLIFFLFFNILIPVSRQSWIWMQCRVQSWASIHPALCAHKEMFAHFCMHGAVFRAGKGLSHPHPPRLLHSRSPSLLLKPVSTTLKKSLLNCNFISHNSDLIFHNSDFLHPFSFSVCKVFLIAYCTGGAWLALKKKQSQDYWRESQNSKK